jgi:hypothetical protein
MRAAPLFPAGAWSVSEPQMRKTLTPPQVKSKSRAVQQYKDKTLGPCTPLALTSVRTNTSLLPLYSPPPCTVPPGLPPCTAPQVKSKSREVQLHKDSSLGEAVLECYPLVPT